VTTKKAGTKTLLNAELQREICYLLSQGVPVGATCDAVGITQATYHAWIAKGEEGRAPYREFVEGTTRARGQARVSLLEKITLSNDWRAHAWLLSHCWPEEFSESRILQPGQKIAAARRAAEQERQAELERRAQLEAIEADWQARMQAAKMEDLRNQANQANINAQQVARRANEAETKIDEMKMDASVREGGDQ
jgi:hypothetical protein